MRQRSRLHPERPRSVTCASEPAAARTTVAKGAGESEKHAFRHPKWVVMSTACGPQGGSEGPDAYEDNRKGHGHSLGFAG